MGSEAISEDGQDRGASQGTGSSLGKGKTGFEVTKTNVRKILDTIHEKLKNCKKRVAEGGNSCHYKGGEL